MTATATPPDGSATVTLNPGTCLLNGTVMTVTATGLIAGGSDNYLGTMLECESDPNQPTVSFLGKPLPVSCTGALADSFTPTAGGTLAGTFTVVEGVTGPPVEETDSAGNPSAQDAADYPCPPTQAQVAAGNVCQIVLSDAGGDRVIVPLTFYP